MLLQQVGHAALNQHAPKSISTNGFDFNANKQGQPSTGRIQNNVLVHVLGGKNAELEVPLPMRIVTRVPALQRLMARLLGMSVRPEHVRSPAT